MFRVIRPNLIEALAKRCMSSASFTPVLSTQASPAVTSRTVFQKHQLVLPLEAQQRRYEHNLVTMSTFEKMKWDLGMYGRLRVPKHHLLVSGFKLYVSCTDLIDFSEFVTELNIPDTFTGWFLVLQLHLWLLHVKLSQMGKEGLLLTQHIYRNMWMDVERRLNTFQELLGSEKAGAMKKYHSVMCTSILYYDEGLLGTDSQLANSLWVQLFSMDESIDPRHLELMVEYVRKQAHHLDNHSENLIMSPGYVSFLPLRGSELPSGKVEKDLETLKKLSY